MASLTALFWKKWDGDVSEIQVANTFALLLTTRLNDMWLLQSIISIID